MQYQLFPSKDPREYIEKTFINTGLASSADIVSGCHCMTPKYLLNQLDSSLRNLDVETIDIYYLHNPETQLGKVSTEEFEQSRCRSIRSFGKRRRYRQNPHVRHGDLELLSQRRRR